jgi:glutaredoxin
MFWHRSTERSGGDGTNALPDGASVELVLYKFDGCPFCRRVHRAIDQLGVDIEYRDVRVEPRWRADLLERTGRTQVPCLFIDDEPMFESLDIVDWLERSFDRGAVS